MDEERENEYMDRLENWSKLEKQPGENNIKKSDQETVKGLLLSGGIYGK